MAGNVGSVEIPLIQEVVEEMVHDWIYGSGISWNIHFEYITSPISNTGWW